MTPAFGAPSLNHWTTREVPNSTIKKKEGKWLWDGPLNQPHKASQPASREEAAALSAPPGSLGRALPVTRVCSLGIPLRLCTLLRKRAAPGHPALDLPYP